MTKPSARELIAKARDQEARNGNLFGVVLRFEWTEDILTLATEMEATLLCLEEGRAEDAILRLRAALGV